MNTIMDSIWILHMNTCLWILYMDIIYRFFIWTRFVYIIYGWHLYIYIYLYIFLHMDTVYDYCIYTLLTASIHGHDIWILYTDTKFEYHLQILFLGSIFGSYLWILYMDTLCGYDMYRHSLEILHIDHVYG